jgi:heavy metal sensor kinase
MTDNAASLLNRKSIRLRLLVWYAVVLVAVIGAFAGALYYQVRTDRLRALDARLQAAANYLEATVRSLPPHELERLPPGAPRDRMPGVDRPFRERRGDDPFGPDGPPPEHGPPPQPPRPRPAAFDDRGPPQSRAPERRPPRGPQDRPPLDRLQAMVELPESILDPPSDRPQDRPYFVVWRADGGVLARSDASEPIPNPFAAVRPSGEPAGFRWRAPSDRETLIVGPRGTLILVGKSAARELGELRTFAWRLLASGVLVLAVGLAGAWLISRSITRPIAAISRTASEISATHLARRIETADLDRELVGLATVLNQMFERLEAAFDRQSRFTADASHELRTPLAVIHAHAELALSKPRSAEEYRETLLACLKAASRMATLVDGLLTLARADAGKLDVRFATVDLRAIVAEVVEGYAPQARSAGIAIAKSLDQPATVKGDPALLARVSSNLLSNALRYTPQGGRVKVTLSAEGPAAVLIVEDTGCGIAPEDQSKVFERFFRADKARSRAQGGSGLGLAICKTLVEVHQGTIGFTSVPDRGTRFEVRLPLETAAPTLLPPPVS